MCRKRYEHCPTCPHPHYLGIYNCKTLSLSEKPSCPTPLLDQKFKLNAQCERCKAAKLTADKAERLRIPNGDEDLEQETELKGKGDNIVFEECGLNVYAVPSPREEKVRREHRFGWGW